MKLAKNTAVQDAIECLTDHHFLAENDSKDVLTAVVKQSAGKNKVLAFHPGIKFVLDNTLKDGWGDSDMVNKTVKKLFPGAAFVQVSDLFDWVVEGGDVASHVKNLAKETKALSANPPLFSYHCRNVENGTVFLLANSHVKVADLASFLQTNIPRWKALSCYDSVPKSIPAYVMPGSPEAKIPLETLHKQICDSLQQPEL